ncbi:fructosamine deglycase [Spirochaetia bacterium]|nr:fructosamine deglycase [Spirochaetia bacterium]
MLKFDEQRQLASINGGLALRDKIEQFVDTIWKDGFDSIYYLGIGGTYASSMQAVSYMAGQSSLPVYMEHAAEYLTNGNRRITPKSVVVISSVSGTTEEIVAAVDILKKQGTRVLGFIDAADSPLAKKVDYLISYPTQEQLKFFMVANRLMYHDHTFDDYDRYNQNMETFLAKALVETEKAADDFGLQFARAHKDDAIHYFVGAGTQWGATYSYAMCFWEEQHWLRTKSIHAGEFFHGTLEIIDRDTPVTVYIGEDKERPLAERVAKFLPRVCARYTIIDTKGYPLTGILPEYRGTISHLVMRIINQRIDAHIEELNCHPTEIRRYYRKVAY